MVFFVCANVVVLPADTQSARYFENLYFDCCRFYRDLINVKLSGQLSLAARRPIKYEVLVKDINMPHFMFEKLLLGLDWRGEKGEHIVHKEYNNGGYTTEGAQYYYPLRLFWLRINFGKQMIYYANNTFVTLNTVDVSYSNIAKSIKIVGNVIKRQKDSLLWDTYKPAQKFTEDIAIV